MKMAITQALRERFERLRRKRRVGVSERLLAIGKDCAPRLKEPYRSGRADALLYDDQGLPK